MNFDNDDISRMKKLGYKVRMADGGEFPDPPSSPEATEDVSRVLRSIEKFLEKATPRPTMWKFTLTKNDWGNTTEIIATAMDQEHQANG